MSAHCIFNSALKCAFDNLCDAWGCIEAGNWGPGCQESLDKAKVCLGVYDE